MKDNDGLDKALDQIIDIMQTLEALDAQAKEAGIEGNGNGLSAHLYQATRRLSDAGDALLARKRVLLGRGA